MAANLAEVFRRVQLRDVRTLAGGGAVLLGRGFPSTLESLAPGTQIVLNEYWTNKGASC